MNVLRITSRFHSPSPWFRDKQRSELLRKFHTIGGMQSQIYLLTKALSELGIYQEIITTKPLWNQSIEN